MATSLDSNQLPPEFRVESVTRNLKLRHEPLNSIMYVW